VSILKLVSVSVCPGLGQDRVNFHQKLGGATAALPDQNWPNFNLNDLHNVLYFIMVCIFSCYSVLPVSQFKKSN